MLAVVGSVKVMTPTGYGPLPLNACAATALDSGVLVVAPEITAVPEPSALEPLLVLLLHAPASAATTATEPTHPTVVRMNRTAAV